MHDDDVPRRRIFVWPIKVQRKYDNFQRQHILKVWLRWPTYRAPMRKRDYPDGSCGACGAEVGTRHHRKCINWKINRMESNA